MSKNPFNLTFGVKTENYIQRTKNYNDIINYFDEQDSFGKSYIISGIRGSGKTAMLTEIQEYYKSKEEWIVVELLSNQDMLEQFASKIIDITKYKKLSIDYSMSFSFVGLTFSISGKEKVLNINTLIENILKDLKKRNINVLISIDDISKNGYLKTFTQEFQYLIRNNYQVYLLMTGLYNNIYDLQNDKSLTFLLRTPKITIDPLLLSNISSKYQTIFDVPKEDANKMALLTKGYAFCYQLLGRIMWDKNKKMYDNDVLDVLDQTLYEYSYERIYEELSDVDKKIISVFKENRIYLANEIIEKSDIDIKLYSQYRDRLIKRGIIISRGYGKIELSLPRFNESIDKYYFNK